MRLSGIACVLLLSLAACHDGGPTAPTPSGTQIGKWAGTAVFADPTCGSSEPITAEVVRSPAYLSVFLDSKCYGSLRFYGATAGGECSGTVVHRCGPASPDPYSRTPSVSASWSGREDGNHIHLESAAAANGFCVLPGITIELSR